MTRPTTIRAADLFCGAGGMTTGLAAAAKELGLPVKLVAVNHWGIAIASHRANHPWAEHLCASLTDGPADGRKRGVDCVDSVSPETAVRTLGGRGRSLDILMASPECTHHSRARGGKPRDAQSRATPWCVIRWVGVTRPKAVLVENVAEFVHWGPLGVNGKPLKRQRGTIFKAWVRALEAYGYRAEWRVLNAADYGDATTRSRFFLQAVRGRRRIVWPEPTHAPADKADDLGLKPWRAARETIDWTIPGQSIFTRKRPLAPNTIRRIAVGIEKYWGAWAKPFLVMMYGTSTARSLEEPLPTVTAQGQHLYLASPFLVVQNHAASASHDKRYTKDVEAPLPTATSQHNRFGLAEPLIVPQHGGADARGVRHPLSTIATRGAIQLAEPFVMPISHGGVPRSRAAGEPLPTLTGSREQYMVEPFVVPASNGTAPRSVGDPVNTIVASARGMRLISPLLVRYDSSGTARSIDEPVGTLTTHHRFGLAEPGIVVDREGNRYALDIRFRMLQPAELAAAMSFPPEYVFKGTKTDTVRQIGNAVAVRTATALCRAILGGVARTA